MEPRVMTTTEVADLLGVNRRQVATYCTVHGLPTERIVPGIGRYGMRLYWRADVLAWMRSVWPTIRRGRPRRQEIADD